MGDTCYEKFCIALRRCGLTERGQRVLVALSGGADSVALLVLMIAYRDRADAHLHLEAAHLNHCLRGPDSDGDEAFSRRLCERFGIACRVARRDVAKEEGGGLEASARRVRYRFLRAAARRIGARWVATGHHADDNVETILHHVLRGTGVRGLAGIPRRRLLGQGGPFLIRPLLDHSRAELRNYLAAQGFCWREDSTNRSLGPMRNRIRHVLLPALGAHFHPQIPRLVGRLGACAEALNRFGVRAAERWTARVDIAEGAPEATFDAAWFRGVPGVLQGEVLHELVRRCGARLGDFTERHYRRLMAVCRQVGGADRVDLPGVTAWRSGGRVRIAPAPSPAPGALGPLPLRVPGTTALPDARGVLRVARVTVDDVDVCSFFRSKGAAEEVLDAAKVAGGLEVRSWRAGERFRPLGAPGRRKLHDFFTDAHVPAFERSRVPVVADAEGIVWVVGYRLADRVKVTRQTRSLLHLRYEPCV